MQVELPADLSRALVRDLIHERVPFKSEAEFRARPFETVIFNLYTRMIHDWLWSLTERGIVKSRFAQEQERYGLLMALLTMVVRKAGGKVVVERASDGQWYEDNDVQLVIQQDDDKMTLVAMGSKDETTLQQ